MKGFRECLSRCGLFDLGFVGQRFTWCNRRLGEQQTLLRFDRMVANASWMELFQDARVHHFSMASSDHCLLSLSLKKGQPKKSFKKCFLFEAMWMRERGTLSEGTRNTRSLIDLRVVKRIFNTGIGKCLAMSRGV